MVCDHIEVSGTEAEVEKAHVRIHFYLTIQHSDETCFRM